MMEEGIEERGEKTFRRKKSGKSFKLRPHDKAEERKQRREWLKRKREKMRQNKHELVFEEESRVRDTEVPSVRKEESRVCKVV